MRHCLVLFIIAAIAHSIAVKAADILPALPGPITPKLADIYQASSYNLQWHYKFTGQVAKHCLKLRTNRSLAHLSVSPDDYSPNDDRYDVIFAHGDKGKAAGNAARNAFIARHGAPVYCKRLLASYGPTGEVAKYYIIPPEITDPPVQRRRAEPIDPRSIEGEWVFTGILYSRLTLYKKDRKIRIRQVYIDGSFGDKVYHRERHSRGVAYRERGETGYWVIGDGGWLEAWDGSGSIEGMRGRPVR